MKMPLLNRNISRRMLAYGAAFTALASLLLAVVLTFGTGSIRRCGRTFKMPVPPMSIRIDSRENRATYAAIGDPDFKSLYEIHGARLGWGPARPGDDRTWSIQSTQDENLTILVFTSQRGPFNVFEFRVGECGIWDCVSPPPPVCPKNFQDHVMDRREPERAEWYKFHI